MDGAACVLCVEMTLEWLIDKCNFKQNYPDALQ